MNNYINNLALSLDLRQRLGQFGNTRSLIKVSKISVRKQWRLDITQFYRCFHHQGHPTTIFGKYLFGRRFEI